MPKFCAKAVISGLLDVTEVMPIALFVWCSEIQPLEVRAAACSFNVAMNMLFTFVIGQCFVTMLCHMEWGVFLFFAGQSPFLRVPPHVYHSMRRRVSVASFSLYRPRSASCRAMLHYAIAVDSLFAIVVSCTVFGCNGQYSCTLLGLWLFML